jgi:hypothetical protein
MNIYKITCYDGYNSVAHIIEGFDLIQAIQSCGYIIFQSIIKAELIGSTNIQNHISEVNK